MKVIIAGHHLDIGDYFKEYMEDEILKKVKKYFEHAITAHITVTKEKQRLIACEIFVNEGTGNGVVIKSTAHDFDPYRSFDHAVDKIEKQLRRYKHKIKDHQKNNSTKDAYLDAKSYVISPFGDEHEHTNNDSPIIIAEKMTQIETLTVSDAVMKMDLMECPALIFVNKANNRVNLVYYRKDGNISWLDLVSN